jgi:hypothetical protein
MFEQVKISDIVGFSMPLCVGGDHVSGVIGNLRCRSKPE